MQRKSQPADAGVVGSPRDAGGTSLLARAIALLARREHSRAELARKLMRRLDEGQDRSDVDAVLDELERRRLLSDERFAKSLVRTRAPRFGEARLKLELKTRGVPAAIAADALESLHAGGQRPNWTAPGQFGPVDLARRRSPLRTARVRRASSSRGGSAPRSYTNSCADRPATTPEAPTSGRAAFRAHLQVGAASD